MKRKKFKVLVVFIFTSWYLAGWPVVWGNPRFPPAITPIFATASITTATGGSAISADTTGGTYTSLTNPRIVEGALGDVGAGTIILNAPFGFVFDTGTQVTLTVTSGSCSGGGNAPVKVGTGGGASSETVTPTSSAITNNVKSASKGASGCISTLTYTNVKVRPSAGTPLATGNITRSGSATIAGADGTTNFGTLIEVAGAKNKLAVTTQPSATATTNTDFTVKPVVKLQDQYGNTVTTDSTSTVARSVVLSNQACGGTAGSGSLTSTPVSGSAVSGGVLTYTAMQYSAVESIKICFTSAGVTSVLSNTIAVNPPPVYSVSVTPDGTIEFGNLEVGQSKNTVAMAATRTASNDGNTTEKLNIKTSATANGTPWALSSAAGVNSYVYEFSTNSGSSWTKFAVSEVYQTLTASLAQGANQNFDLRITAPTSSDFVQKSITVTVQATAP